MHDELVNDVRALKARLCLGLPIIGVVMAQLVATVSVQDDPGVPLSASIGPGDHPSATLVTILAAVAVVVALAAAALQLSRAARIAAIVLAVAYLVATTVLWLRLGGTAEPYDTHPIMGYLALPTAGLWALIGAGSAGRYAD